MKEQLKKLGMLISAILMITAVGGQALAGGLVDEFDFDTVGFTAPLVIDNQYWPQVAGAIFTYFAETEDGCEWNRVVVTHDTDNIDGVTVRVVLDREWLDESDDCADELDNYPAGFPYGELAEITHDRYAQDDRQHLVLGRAHCLARR